MSDVDEQAVAVRDNPAEQRFEITVGTDVAGIAVYRRRPGIIAFIHTEVDERFAHHGLAGKLIEGALGAAREESLAVLPFCPFVDAYIKEHREWADLVPAERRGAFGL